MEAWAWATVCTTGKHNNTLTAAAFSVESPSAVSTMRQAGSTTNNGECRQRPHAMLVKLFDDAQQIKTQKRRNSNAPRAKPTTSRTATRKTLRTSRERLQNVAPCWFTSGNRGARSRENHTFKPECMTSTNHSLQPTEREEQPTHTLATSCMTTTSYELIRLTCPVRSSKPAEKSGSPKRASFRSCGRRCGCGHLGITPRRHGGGYHVHILHHRLGLGRAGALTTKRLADVDHPRL